MFTPWIKRKALKKASKSRRLMLTGERPSMILLLSFTGLLVVTGAIVVQGGRASDSVTVPSPTPSASVSPSPTAAASSYYDN